MSDTHDTPLSSVAAEIEALRSKLSGIMRLHRSHDLDALSIYVHALSTEDVIVQVLLRERPPLMLRYAPDANGAMSWQKDPRTTRRYALATRTATRTFLRRLHHRSAASGATVQLVRPDCQQIAGVLRNLLIPSLTRAVADIESISQRRLLADRED